MVLFQHVLGFLLVNFEKKKTVKLLFKYKNQRVSINSNVKYPLKKREDKLTRPWENAGRSVVMT
jgi:hypothetical protein